MFRRRAEKWRFSRRVIFAGVASLVFFLPQADLLMTLREGWSFPNRIEMVRLILPFTTALLLFLVPAIVVVLSWLHQNRSITTSRALALAFVVNGLTYVPYGLWVNQLIIKYSQP
jgi:hypothetical protein